MCKCVFLWFDFPIIFFFFGVFFYSHIIYSNISFTSFTIIAFKKKKTFEILLFKGSTGVNRIANLEIRAQFLLFFHTFIITYRTVVIIILYAMETGFDRPAVLLLFAVVVQYFVFKLQFYLILSICISIFYVGNLLSIALGFISFRKIVITLRNNLIQI